MSSWQANANWANVNLRERYRCTFIMKKFYMSDNVHTELENTHVATGLVRCLLTDRVKQRAVRHFK